MNKIIMPGDAQWDKNYIPIPEPPKLPDEMLEAVFSDVVKEVKEQIDATEITGADLPPGTEAVVSEGVVPTPPPGPTFNFHRPSRQRSFKIPIPSPLSATLLEDLPRAWEKECFVGGVDYVAVEGQSYKNRVRRPGFRVGDKITLISMIMYNNQFYPGAGAMYEFEEGRRGSFCVRPDQVSFEIPKVAEPQVLDAPAQEIS